MNEEEFWPQLYKAFEHTDVDYERFWMGDEKEGVMYIKFTNVRMSEEGNDEN